MIPSPSSHYAPVGTFSQQPNDKLVNQMQNMKLAPPLPQNYSSSPIMNPGVPSPQHARSPVSTNVTFSGTSKATYPYMNNNNHNTGNTNLGFQQSPMNNNQYPFQGPPLHSASNETSNKNQSQIQDQSFSKSSFNYSNGVSNGYEPNKSPQNGIQSSQQVSGTEQKFGPAQSAMLSAQGQVQHQQSQLNPISSEPHKSPHMNQLQPPGLSSPHQPIQSQPQPVFQPYPSHGMGFKSPAGSSQLPGMSPSQFSGMPPQSPSQFPGMPQPQSPSQFSGMPPPQSPSQFSRMPPPQSPSQFSGMPPSESPSQFSGMPSPQGSAQFSGMPPPQSSTQFSGMPPPQSPSQFSGMPPPPNSSQYSGMSPIQANSSSQQWPTSYQSGGLPGSPANLPYGMPNQGVVQQQPQKLVLELMPSIVQVRQEDQKTRCGYFATDTKGLMPPLVTTDFIVQDRGMCSPRFIRSSVYCLPNNPDILKQTGIPFAITISPLASLYDDEKEPPRCLHREEGPLRCKRCKAYMCPFMTFMEGGRVFQCAFCKVVTEVPQDYFCFLDGMGERTDKYHRPELCLGSYEFIATKDYCRKDELPNPPAYIFMIEVSHATFRNGLVPLLCENMKNVLHTLQEDDRIDSSKLKIGFVTYNNVLHFYNMKKNLTQPHIMVLSDVHNAFVPLLEGFLVTLSEAEVLVDSLMEHIPRLFMNELASEIILGPVIQVGLEALKNANCSGKLLVFHSTIPNADAPGKLSHREGQKLLGTDKQKIALAPQTDFYSKLAQECVAAGCAVDLFLFPAAFVDIPSLGPLCRHTGGQLYKYTYFQSHMDGDRFLEDLERNITSPTAYDAVLRVRTSAGISPVFYYGNFFMSNATDIELSAIDCYKAITVEFAYDEKLPENETVFLQAALLYTTSTGVRLIRVHNLAIPTSVNISDVFKCAELDAIINFFAKQALKQLLDHSPQQIKSALLNRAVKILSCYRKNSGTNTSDAQLILPESLKLLPLMVNCLLKSDAVAGGPEMSLDDRSFSILAVNSMDVKSTSTYIYPTLFPIHEANPDAENLPNPIRCSIEKLQDNGAYILENGMYMFLWIGQAISSTWLQDVLGVQSTSLIDKQKASLPELDTPLSKRIRQIIEELEEGRQWYMRLRIMVQGDKLEVVFRHFLVEDRGVDGSPSYIDFMCHLHRQISKNQ